MSVRVMLCLVLLVAGWPVASFAQALQGTAFTYQGELVQNGTPVNGSADLEFALFDAATGGAQVGATLAFTTANGNPVTVTDGIFSVALDFGAAAFAGPAANARWLRVTVNGNVLAPRTKVENAPYALVARNAELAYTVPVSSIGADEIDASQVQLRGTLTDCAGGEVVSGIDTFGNVTCVADANSGGDITGVTAGSGLVGGGASGDVTLAVDTNTVQARVASICAAGFSIRAIAADGSVTCEADSVGQPAWQLNGNAATVPGTDFLGTTDNQALELRVNGLRAARYEPTTGPGTEINVLAGAEGNAATEGVYAATVAGGGSTNVPGANRVSDNFGTVAGGGGNRAGNDVLPTSDASFAVVGGGMQNVASAEGATVAGGIANVASGVNTVVGGGAGNVASGLRANIAGGLNGTASGEGATIAGGAQNAATAQRSFVGSGLFNTASGAASFVGGGESNTASGFRTSVVGGGGNLASGTHATVLGGLANVAAGDFSVAAGRGARVRNAEETGELPGSGCSDNCGDEGTFMFADGRAFTFTSDGPNRFLVRATGGAKFVSAIDAGGAETAGVVLAAGGGSWSSLSDRAAKTNVEAIDPLRILDAVLGLEIAEWSYRAQSAAIRHVGPMAQDFYAAFGVGEDERRISTVDADGVALAAIQGLNAKLEAELASLAAENDRLEARLARLEAKLGEPVR